MSKQDLSITNGDATETEKSVSPSDVKNILKISKSLFKEWQYRTKLWWTQYRLIFGLVSILSLLPLLKLFLPFSNDVKFSFSWAFSFAAYILAMCSYYFLRMQTQKIEETYSTYNSFSKKLLEMYQIESNHISAFSKANTLNAGTTIVLAIISISSFWIAGTYNSDSFMSGSLLAIVAIIMIVACVAIIGKENHEFVTRLLDIIKNIGTYIGKVLSLIGIVAGIIIGAIYILIEGVVKGINLVIGTDSNKGMRGAFNRLKKSINEKSAQHAENKEKSKTEENSSTATPAPTLLVAESSESANSSSEKPTDDVLKDSSDTPLSAPKAPSNEIFSNSDDTETERSAAKKEKDESPKDSSK